jgi:hypothetical protein
MSRWAPPSPASPLVQSAAPDGFAGAGHCNRLRLLSDNSSHWQARSTHRSTPEPAMAGRRSRNSSGVVSRRDSRESRGSAISRLSCSPMLTGSSRGPPAAGLPASIYQWETLAEWLDYQAAQNGRTKGSNRNKAQCMFYRKGIGDGRATRGHALAFLPADVRGGQSTRCLQPLVGSGTQDQVTGRSGPRPGLSGPSWLGRNWNLFHSQSCALTWRLPGDTRLSPASSSSQRACSLHSRSDRSSDCARPG